MVTALELLKRHEGYRRLAYTDTVGKLTVGYGRNLSDKGLTEAEAEYLLRNDIAEAEARLEKLPWWGALDSVRRAVLTDMAVNLGFDGLMKFKKTLRFVEAGWYGAASEEMLASRWAEQVGERARTLSRLMRLGKE